MGDLERYRARRDPGQTPEPFGGERPRRALAADAPRSFVVQQHAARRMHWDLRLEIDDVLVSWAVPRGPSLDPAERRLAVRTEDHPLEYAEFEGVIPSGNYGAGAMIVWDRGTYRSVEGRAPSEGLERGKLDLLLEGHKLRGRFALVRTRGQGENGWLLLHKSASAPEGDDITESEPASVLSGLGVEEIAEGVSRDREVGARATEAGARGPAPVARRLRPMLAAREDRPFSKQGWIFELKYDGVRVLCEKQGEEVGIFARTGAERTGTYPEVARALGHLPLEQFVLDGEVVALDARGRSSFERLQRRFTQSDPAVIARAEAEVPVVLYAFDLLAASGFDLRGLALERRKEILALFAPRHGVIRFADHVAGEGASLFAAAQEHGLEGVVAKRADSRYEAGRRSKRWLKLKVPRGTSLAIVGFLPGRGSRAELGSLMLAGQRNGELVYAGNVGSGLDERTIAKLLPVLERTRVEGPAFGGAPELSSRRAVYVAPTLVCDVRYTEVTSAGLLRHPVFSGLREEVTPDQCRAPEPRADSDTAAPAPAAPEPGLELTRLEKVFWPVEGYTKRDLLEYYEAIWPWLAPYLRDRPVVLTRYPDGIEGKNFYQKNAPDFTPSWVRRERIDDTDYFICNDLRTLLYVVNSGAIPLHVWSARLATIERPDWLIIDLDPKEAPFSRVVEVALYLHHLLRDMGAQHYVKTSGQDGLHVLLPLGERLDHGEARALAEVLARVVCADLPEIATVARPLAARGGKVYVDFLQNGRGKLIAAPFSVRPRRGAPVSTPLTWRQVGVRLDPARWTIRSAPRRLAQHGDPMRPLLEGAVDVPALLEALGRRLGEAVG